MIGIKYCGGCNETYDRVGTVRKLIEKLTEESSGTEFESASLEFEPAVPDKEYDAILMVYGCATKCVSPEGLNAPDEMIFEITGSDISAIEEILTRHSEATDL